MTDHSGRRQGVGARDPEGATAVRHTGRTAFHTLVYPVARYIAQQPTPDLMRAAAGCVAAAVLLTGDDLAKGGTNRWEGE